VSVVPHIVLSLPDRAWTFDLASLAAILTFVGTGALAFFTWRLAKDTRKLASETAEDVRSEWRPVVVAVVKDAFVTVPHGAELGALTVELENGGKGPAINVKVCPTTATSASREVHQTVELGTLLVGRGNEVTVENVPYRDPSGTPQSSLRYELTIEYEDLARRVYRTDVVYVDPKNGQNEAGQPQVPLKLNYTFVWPTPADPEPVLLVPTAQRQPSG
jgi:hypothetical protein